MGMSVSDLAAWVLYAALIYMSAALVVHLVEARRSKGEEPDFSDIETWLRGLLLNGQAGESILFRHERTGRFVRFEKYDDAGAGIALTFPKIGWGRDHLTRLQAWCESRGLSVQASVDGLVGGTGYARVAFGGDVASAFALSKTIWAGFYGYGLRDRHSRSFSDYSTAAELTRFPPATADSATQKERFWRYQIAWMEHVGLGWLGVTGLLIVSMASVLSLLVSTVGLPVSTLSSLGEPPDWRLGLGPFLTQGSGVSLTFFILYVLSFTVLRRVRK